jgi:hypothetical protein
MLLAAKEEYASEGLPPIALKGVSLEGLDNVKGRALIEAKGSGLFYLLEEECMVRSYASTPVRSYARQLVS